MNTVQKMACMQGKLKSSKIQTCTTDHASYSLTQWKFEQLTFKWLSGTRAQDKNKQDYNCVHFFLFSFYYAGQRKFVTRRGNFALNYTWNIGFQVQFNTEFSRQVMNCPIVFFWCGNKKKRGEHFERQKQPQKFNFSNNINVTDCSVLGILKWKTFRNSPLTLPKPLAKIREKLDMFLLKKIALEN